MIGIHRRTKIFICKELTDMRASYDSLFHRAKSVFNKDPFSGHLFVFINKKRTSCKTSIPGICAKPIIDIVGSVDRIEDLDAKAGQLERIGYEYKGEYGIPGRRYSVLYNPDLSHKNTMLYASDKFPSANFIEFKDDQVHPYRYGNKGVEDGFMSLTEQALAADRVIFATPVYWYTMSGIMKDFIDRFSNLLGGPGKELGEKLYGKKIELLSTGSDLEVPNGFVVPFGLTATYFGMDFMGFNYKSISQNE